MNASLIINTCSGDPLAGARANPNVGKPYSCRADILREALAEAYLQHGWDEIIVVGQVPKDIETNEAVAVTTIQMLPVFRDRRDALHQREMGARRSTGDWLVFSHDDHKLDVDFLNGLRNLDLDPMDLIVPQRLSLHKVYNDIHAVLPNGSQDTVDGPYMGGHALAMSRQLWSLVPWTSVDTEFWDLPMTRIWREAGANLRFEDSLIHYDCEV